MTTIKKWGVTLWKVDISEDNWIPSFLGYAQIDSWRWYQKIGLPHESAEVVLRVRDVEEMQALDELRNDCNDDYLLQLRIVRHGRRDNYDGSEMIAELSKCYIVDKSFVGLDTVESGPLILTVTIKAWIRCNWEQVLDFLIGEKE